jgi:hypothetical protein
LVASSRPTFKRHAPPATVEHGRVLIRHCTATHSGFDSVTPQVRASKAATHHGTDTATHRSRRPGGPLHTAFVLGGRSRRGGLPDLFFEEYSSKRQYGGSFSAANSGKGVSVESPRHVLKRRSGVAFKLQKWIASWSQRVICCVCCCAEVKFI